MTPDNTTVDVSTRAAAKSVPDRDPETGSPPVPLGDTGGERPIQLVSRAAGRGAIPGVRRIARVRFWVMVSGPFSAVVSQSNVSPPCPRLSIEPRTAAWSVDSLGADSGRYCGGNARRSRCAAQSRRRLPTLTRPSCRLLTGGAACATPMPVNSNEPPITAPAAVFFIMFCHDLFLSVGKFRVRSPDAVTDVHSPTGSSWEPPCTALDVPLYFRDEDSLDQRTAKPDRRKDLLHGPDS